MSDKQLLMQLDGVGETRATALLNHFENGREVAKSACRYWYEITKVSGFTDEEARKMFDKMKDAEVFHDLRGY